jgi:hypothetical protein
MDDVMQLGGNIELSGFRDINGASMVILKKMIGNYARKMSEISDKFEKLHVKKTAHEDEKGRMYHIQAEHLNDGKAHVSEFTDKNLFVAVDSALKKIMEDIS